ncbi:hypothetical protein LTR16_012580 [Cryomyces antarcticus]|uniref:ATPase AAA-type core domain-containing protein n=1 Tax=Cryomyces antarcticus TaxID=329879 RepID=A0ABR0IST5_9PEZI|nr:hypothetical protein LTR16_012580 [Cryomyces antarcticus]
MFLTTNRVDTFDAAFQSRIHISLDYPELSSDSRRMVWKNFLAQAGREHRHKHHRDVALVLAKTSKMRRPEDLDRGADTFQMPARRGI